MPRINEMVYKSILAASREHYSFNPHAKNEFMCKSLDVIFDMGTITLEELTITKEWINSHILEIGNDPEDTLYGALYYKLDGIQRYTREDVLYLVWSAIIDKLLFDLEGE